MIGGFLGLGLGPAGLGILPFSDYLGDYASVLIVVVFACLAMNADFRIHEFGRSIGQFFGYSVFMYSFQILFGFGLVLLFLGPIFGVPDAFGVVLFAGWAGGFGTAAAFGQVFGDAGLDEIQSLAFTSATVGLLVGIIGGIILAKIGAERGHAQEYAGLGSIPEETRTGVLAQEHGARPAIGTHVFSGSSIDSLAFQAGVVAAICAAAYGTQQGLLKLLPNVVVPVFSLAFIVGLIVHFLMIRTNAIKFIDRDSVSSLSGTATDVLIFCGIASIVPALVADYAWPLLILFTLGLACVLSIGIFVAPQVMEQSWFEKQLFTWGWATGAVAQGIALLRIVDPKLNSRTLEEYALQSVVNQNEILAVTFIPALVLGGLAWAVVGIWGTVTVLAAILLVVLRRGGRHAFAGTYRT